MSASTDDLATALSAAATSTGTPFAKRAGSVLRSERPWGAFEQFVLNEPCTVKVITVAPGHRLSLQVHSDRDEMWQVLDVPLDVQVGDATWTAQVGERVLVPRGTDHRLGNSGEVVGRILEVAFGTFDECDILRLEDDYTRD